jgi:hypothetical protein
VRFNGFDEMHGVGLGEILYAEIVDAESECGALRAMAPETWGERHGFVSGWFQFLNNELVESENADFFEAVHAVTDFEVDVAVTGDGNGVAVIAPDFFWNDGWADSYVLEVRHGRSEVEVFDVEAEVAGSVFGIRNCTVDVELGVEHGDSWGAGVAGVVEFVAAGCYADAMGFGLLGADVADEICVGDPVVLGDLGFFDEEYCSSAFYLFGGGSRDAEAVGEESTPFVGKGAFPDGCVGTAKELGKGALFAGCWWSGGERSDVVGLSFVGIGLTDGG